MTTTGLGDNKIKDDPKIYACLVDGFCKGFTDAEACLAAGISTGTLYSYTEQFPAFTEYKENLKLNPIVTAKSTVVAKLHEDVKTAKWYLERRSEEFKPKPDTQINQLFIGTEAQMKTQLAHKLTKLLALGDTTGSITADDNVTDGEVIGE